MPITQTLRGKIVVAIMALLIALSPLVMSPSGDNSESSLVQAAMAHKKCPPNRHFHRTDDPSVQVMWWTYKHRNAGPNQLAWYWKSQANVPGGRVVLHGYKVC